MFKLVEARPAGATWKASAAAKRRAREAIEIFIVDIIDLDIMLSKG